MSILHKIQAARAKGRRMAKARWKKDQALRAALTAEAEKDPLRATGRIVRRVVIIDDESTVREIVRRDYHSARDWARMKKKAGL